ISFAMNEKVDQKENFLQAGVTWLREALPATWTVGPSNRMFTSAAGTWRADGAIDIVSGQNQGSVTVVIETKRSFSARDVERFTEPLAQNLRALSFNVPILVVSDWLSPRTRELLQRQGINY